MKITKIHYVSLGKTCAVFGFFIGAYYGLQLLAISALLSGNLSALGAIISITAGATVISGILAGFILGIITALIYNKVIAKIGPLELELRE